MSDTTKIIVAFAAGTLAGVIAGVLFAPDKGFETRRKLSEQGKKIAGSLKDSFFTGKEKLTGLAESIRENEREKMEELA